MSDDLELVKKARKGDREAFDRLFERHSDRLIAFALKLTSDRSQAEDLVQEAFLAALKGLAGYHGKGAFFSWLCGIAVRKQRDHRRKPDREVALTVDLALPPEVPEAAQAIDSLEPKHREAFLLVKVVGLTYDEAGQALRKPAGTVKWLCSEATAQLRSFLSEEAYDAK